MKTKLLLTNENVVVSMGSKSKTIENNEFYSKRSKVYKHIDMRDVNEMFPTARFTVENNKDEMVTLEAMTEGVSKLTQVAPGQSLEFCYDSYM